MFQDVLVLAGIELLFIPVVAVFGFSIKRMLITLMFSVVAMKSRTFSSLPCSANEQMCRSWEGAQPGSQPKLANGNVPYHGHHAQFTNGGWLGGRSLAFLFL